MCTISFFQISKVYLLQKMILLTFKSSLGSLKLQGPKSLVLLFIEDISCWLDKMFGHVAGTDQNCVTRSLCLSVSLCLSLFLSFSYTHISHTLSVLQDVRWGPWNSWWQHHGSRCKDPTERNTTTATVPMCF